MRNSLIHSILASHGASFVTRYGVQCAGRFAVTATEYHRIRDAVGITDFSHMLLYRIPEALGMDFLDTLFAGNVAKIRFGRVLHTFLAGDDGMLLADCYIANNDEEFILACEPLVEDAVITKILDNHGGATAGLENLTDTTVALSVDGLKAWAVIKELFGVDVLGLPYLSIENYDFNGGNVRLFRAGKTSEFGYLLLAPASVAHPLYKKLVELATAQGGGACGVAIHNELRLEGRFFNIHAEGAAVRDPLVLGLQWMIDFDKEKFAGREALLKHREAGVARKIIGIATETGKNILKAGDGVFDDGQKVADVVASCYSHVLDCNVGLAVFPREIGYAGLSFALNGASGPVVRTISMPPIMPKSLGVKLDEM